MSPQNCEGRRLGGHSSLRPILVGLAALITGLAPAWAAERKALPGHVPAVVRDLAPLGRVDAAQPMRLAISLPWRNPDQLQALLADLYNPASTNFHRYLSTAEFTERFGPTEGDYRKLKEFVAANGLTVTGELGNRMLLDVSGAAGDVERAFQVTLQVYQHPTEARTFYAAANEPSVAAGVSALDISGLNNFRLPKPKSLHRAPAGGVHAKGGSGPAQDYTAKDIRAAYAPGVTLNGAGQVVALIEFDGYYAGDITKYRTSAGIASVPIQTVLLDGFDGVPTTGAGSGNNEVALDIEMILALAPGVAQILVYESDPSALANDLLGRMAMDNSAAQLSCSWDLGSGPSDATQQILQQMAAQGQSFFNASGDSGAFVGTINLPDDSPYVTQVGGTTLTTTGPLGKYVSETVWNDGSGSASAGGISQTFPIPAWQKGVSMASNGGSKTYRNVPDVAFLGENVYVVADNGQNETLSGTSCAAPLWAALAALANQKAASLGQPRLGLVNPALYALYGGGSSSTYFRDVTTGNNIETGSNNQFTAVAGYDLCTGIGTPMVGAVAASLALTDTLGVTPFAGFTANGPAGGPFTLTSQTLGLTNAGTASVGWSLGGLPAWLSASTNQGVLGATGAGEQVTLSLTAAANLLPTGVSTANVRFTNLATGSVQIRTVTLQIGQSLVLNGGFETGDFAYWTLTGATADQYNYVDDGTYVAGLTPHSGSWAAALGQNYSQTASVAYLAQPLPTLAGQSYALSFWLSSLADTNGATTPNRFQVYWNGSSLYSVVNQPASGWTYHQFIVTAAGASTPLKFGFTDDPASWGLDDVSVMAIPSPNIQSVSEASGAVTITWATASAVNYQVEYSTALSPSSWQNLGSPVPGDGGTLSYTDPPSADHQRFYRVAIVP